MNDYTLRLKKETALRDYINGWRINAGQDSDAEWWRNRQAVEAMNRLASAALWEVTDSLELHMEDGENLVVTVWNGGVDIQGLTQLSSEMTSRLKKVVEAGKPAYEQALKQARNQSRVFLEKVRTNILFIARDIKGRIAVEMQFAAWTKKWKKQIFSECKVPITIWSTFLVCPEYRGELAHIQGINRYNSLHMEPIGGRSNTESQCESTEDFVQSAVMTVQLKQLVELYNQVGDQLFKDNVRFGIAEAFDVSKAIRNTLMEEPQHFWYKNNGITLLVENPDFRLEHLDELQLGRLEANHSPQFSVVNGAQTITISAKYAFELECKKQESEAQKEPEEEQEKEVKKEKEKTYQKQLEDFAKAQVILRVIHIPIQSKQEAAAAECKKIQAAKKLARDISVSLNRQKPIRAEDIAFTSPFVQKMEEYLSSPQNNPPFQLIRRGEEQPQASQLSLVDFARARLACMGRPDKARTTSRDEILKMDIANGTLLNTDVFVENWTESEDNEHEVFQRFYGAVWFADEIAKLYAKNAKAFENNNINAQIAVQNGKWYFTALAVQLLNDFRSKDGQPDFSEFHWIAQNFVYIISQAVEAFSQMAACCADPERQLNSNDFKNESYYQKLLAELRSGKKAAPFEKFSKLFVPDRDNLLPQKKSTQQKITAIILGSVNGPVHVNSAKEAFVKTVIYLLNSFSPEESLLAQYDTWLTADSQKGTSPKGNFNANSPSIMYHGKEYWVGSEALSNDSKFAHIRSLCKLAQVPQGEIFWLVDDTVRYQW